MNGPLTQLLSRKAPLILDGAMGTELHRRGVDTGLPLWSANGLITHPETVLAIHKEYIAAGADIVTTNTFRTTMRTFKRANLPDRSEQLTLKAVQCAQEAREAFPDRSILIAGSIAPLEDCYRPDLVPPDNELKDEHAGLTERLAKLDVDFLLLETMNTIREAYIACEQALTTGKEVIVSFICRKDSTLYSGEKLEDAIKTLSALRPTAFSVNCVSPRFLGHILATVTSLTSLPIAVYGNAGLPEDERQDEQFTVDVSEDEYARLSKKWLQTGASIIGGCCGTTPNYIRTVRGSF
jgi:S-methylmethionine-dependent homocysteine/selenocysteine methylase